jgi:hypothetical protein
VRAYVERKIRKCNITETEELERLNVTPDWTTNLY